MCLLFLLVMVVTVTSVPCNKLPEWLIFSQVGIDMVSFDPFSTTPGWKRVILSFSCDKNYTFNDEYTGETFDRPDQIDSILAVPGSIAVATEFHADTSDSWGEHMSEYFKIDHEGWFSSFSGSKSFSESAADQFNASCTAGLVFAEFSSFKIESIPPIPGLLDLSDEAKQVYKALFADDMVFSIKTVSKYEEWFSYYGTHFSSILQLGGIVAIDYSTTFVEEAVETDAEFSANAHASFFHLINASGGGGVGGNASAHFIEASKISNLKTLGGIGQPTVKTWAEWTKSVPRAPHVNAAQLEPIYSLFSDSKQADNMKKATRNHFDKATLTNIIIPGLIGIIQHNLYISASGDTSCKTLPGVQMVPEADCDHNTGCCGGSGSIFLNASNGGPCDCYPTIPGFALTVATSLDKEIAAVRKKANSTLIAAKSLLKNATAMSVLPIVNPLVVAQLVTKWTSIAVKATSSPIKKSCDFIYFKMSSCCWCPSCCQRVGIKCPHLATSCPSGPRSIVHGKSFIKYPKAFS